MATPMVRHCVDPEDRQTHLERINPIGAGSPAGAYGAATFQPPAKAALSKPDLSKYPYPELLPLHIWGL